MQDDMNEIEQTLSKYVTMLLIGTLMAIAGFSCAYFGLEFSANHDRLLAGPDRPQTCAIDQPCSA